MHRADHSRSSSARPLADADGPESRSLVVRRYVSTIALALLFLSLAIVADVVGASDPRPGPAARIVTATH